MKRHACVLLILLGGCASGAPLEPNVLTDEERRDGWKLLFDGRTTQGWRGYRMKEAPPGWQAVDGTLARVSGGAGGKGAGGGDDLVTVDEYDNFELTLEWKVSPGGNSGILYRIQEDADASFLTAPEFQLLDNAGFPKNRPNTTAGACYDLYAPSRDVVRPAGQWNRARLVVDGHRVEHWLNGEQVVTYELWSEDWNRRLAASKFKALKRFARQPKGRIALQDHTNRLEFRDIKIRPLSRSSP